MKGSFYFQSRLISAELIITRQTYDEKDYCHNIIIHATTLHSFFLPRHGQSGQREFGFFLPGHNNFKDSLFVATFVVNKPPIYRSWYCWQLILIAVLMYSQLFCSKVILQIRWSTLYSACIVLWNVLYTNDILYKATRRKLKDKNVNFRL